MLPVIRRVAIPTFEIASNPKIRLSDLKRGPRKICPVCNGIYFGSDFMEHVRSSSDDGHAILEVTES